MEAWQFAALAPVSTRPGTSCPASLVGKRAPPNSLDKTLVIRFGSASQTREGLTVRRNLARFLGDDRQQEPQQEPQPLGDVLTELFAWCQGRFPRLKIVVVLPHRPFEARLN
jgi:hypothetical protein